MKAMYMQNLAKKYYTIERRNIMKKIVALLSLAIMLLCSTAFIAEAEVKKESEPMPEATAYGSYYDQSSQKAMKKSVTLDSKRIDLTYVRTENLKDAPLDKRSDSFGTYDVYVDANNKEYLYLINTETLCGFKNENIGCFTPQGEAIVESKAKEIALNFLNKYNTAKLNYIFMSCVYDELAGIYDIQYCYIINGYKTDDIFRIWVNAKGEIASFSAFNYGRYKNTAINENDVETAQNKTLKQINDSKNNVQFKIVDSYITITDSGKIALVQVVDYTNSMGENYTTYREAITQLLD